MTIRFALMMLAVVSAQAAGAVAGAPKTTKGWTFEQLLRSPTEAELRHFDRDWAGRKWDIGAIKLLGITKCPVGVESFEARLYTYTLNGSPGCGAILLPGAAEGKPLAGLVDIGDISWDYRDRDLTNGPYVARILGDRAREFALVVPCARGMGLRVAELRVQSGGDRRDAWEGTAEEAIAFLTVALSVTPRIDPARLGVYGYSRGGGVALIVGERDRRIKAVLDFAGPADWFSAMGRPGENWPARLEEAWRDAALPADTRESQFLDFFVRDRETMSLADLRRRLIAASPLYFASKLPALQVHQGEADAPVPVRNVTALRDRLGAERAGQCLFIYPGAGHLLDDTPALGTARAFLIERLVAPGP